MDFDSYTDIIDTREIIERLAELRDEIETDPEDTDARENELVSLGAFADELRNCAGDYEYGAGLIRDSYFVGVR